MTENLRSKMQLFPLTSSPDLQLGVLSNPCQVGPCSTSRSRTTNAHQAGILPGTQESEFTTPAWGIAGNPLETTK